MVGAGVVLDVLWHFATVGKKDVPYWHAYVGASLVHHRVVHDPEQLALLVGLPMLTDGCDRNVMINVLQQLPGIDLNKFETF